MNCLFARKLRRHRVIYVDNARCEAVASPLFSN